MYPIGYKLYCMTISEHIKTRRKQYGLTQVELAERAGVGLRFVRELERGGKGARVRPSTAGGSRPAIIFSI